MNRLIALVLLSFFAMQTQAQKSDLGNWLLYFGNKKINNKWNWHNEVQYRNYNIIGDLEQLLVRTGVGYNLSENNNNLLLGYGYIYSENYIADTEDKVRVNEHRIYQQFVTKHKITKLNVKHRFRLEERWVNTDFKFRFRYALGLSLPLNNKTIEAKTWYLAMYNEIFLNGAKNVFDRNRLYGGVGYRINPSVKIEVGYMNQFFIKSNRDQINIITSINF